MGQISKKTLRDNRILELFASGKDAIEVSEILGIAPEAAYKRVKELLADGDIFDTIEKRKLLIFQLKALYAKANDFLDNVATDKSWAQGIAAITKLLETTYEIQVKEEMQSVEEIEAATRAQAGVIIKAVEMAYMRARQLLEAEYPKVKLEDVDAAFQAGLAEITP